MSIAALDIYWRNVQSVVKSNWKYAAAFTLGSLISFAASYSLIKYVTGYSIGDLIFSVVWRLKAAKYRDKLEYDGFSIKPKIRPSTACIGFDALLRSTPKGPPNPKRNIYLDKNSKYYYLKSRNNFNKNYEKHRLPAYMETPRKITIDNNWKGTGFELNGYLYKYPGCTTDNGLLLYIHGGGFIMGNYRLMDGWICILMQKLGICVLSLEYQLAPEINGIPNQVLQCVDAYKYVIDKLGIDKKKVFIGGTSAGGTLSLLTLQKLNELKLDQPCAGFMISLLADISSKIAIETEKKYDIEDAMMGKGWNAEFASALYINDNDRKTYNNEEIKILQLPSYSPLYGNFKGMCPIYLSASQNELLIGDSKEILKKCNQSGVDVQYLWDECLPHATLCFAGIVPEARDSLIIMIEWMKKQLKK